MVVGLTRLNRVVAAAQCGIQRRVDFAYRPPLSVPLCTLYPEIVLGGARIPRQSKVCWMVTAEPLAVVDIEVELLVKNQMFAEAIPIAVEQM